MAEEIKKENPLVNKPSQTNGGEDNGVVLKPLRTYSEDIKKTLDTENMSVIKIAVAESKKREAQEKNEEENSISTKKNITLLIVSVILIVLGLGVVGFLIYSYQKTPVVVPVKNDIEIISSDSKTEMSVDNSYRRKILKDLALEELKAVPPNTIKKISFFTNKDTTKKVLSADEFLSIMETRLPESFSRFLKPDFIFGVYSSVDGNKPFLILKTTSFENTYASMLDWEENMADDLVDLISASSSPNTTTTLLSKTFSDMVIKNKDTRVVKDPNGKIVMFYSVVDNETVVFTGDELAFAEILSRLQLKKLVR